MSNKTPAKGGFAFGGKNKLTILISLSLLSASCSFFGSTLPAGVIKSVNGGVDWQFVNTLKNVENGTLSRSNFSKLDFYPQNRQTIFASSYTDGLFKSEDAGESWSKILSKIAVYDFAINPQDPKIIYAAGYYAEHGRVLKTLDGGASWTQIYNEESTLNAARSIALNPQNPNQVIIGTTSGNVIKSADGGNTWQLAKNLKDRINRVLWQNGNIYVLGRAKGLYKSSGFADNFEDITISLSKVYSASEVVYNAVNPIEAFNQMFVDHTTPGLIYITTNRGVYKTVDEGRSWQQQSLPVKPEEVEARAIAISKTSSNIVYASVGSTVYKSLDGGTSWQTQRINSAGFVNYLLVDPELPQIVYGGVYSTQ